MSTQVEIGNEARGSAQVQMLLTAEQAAKSLAIGRTKVFDLIRNGELESMQSPPPKSSFGWVRPEVSRLSTSRGLAPEPTIGISTATSSRSTASAGIPVRSCPSTAMVRCRAAGRSASLIASSASSTPTT